MYYMVGLVHGTPDTTYIYAQTHIHILYSINCAIAQAVCCSCKRRIPVNYSLACNFWVDVHIHTYLHEPPINRRLDNTDTALSHVAAIPEHILPLAGVPNLVTPGVTVTHCHLKK